MSGIPAGYERGLVPLLMVPCARELLARILIAPGARVLDAAAGTGILARQLPAARVVALDEWDEMIAFSRGVAPDPAWCRGTLDHLPFRAATFDASLCQHGLPFAEDVSVAIAELARVTRPGGRVGIVVWTSLSTCPGFVALDAAARRHLDAPLHLQFEDDLETRAGLLKLFADAGIPARTDRIQVDVLAKDASRFAEAYVAGSFLAEVEADEAAWRAFYADVAGALGERAWRVDAHVAWGTKPARDVGTDL